MILWEREKRWGRGEGECREKDRQTDNNIGRRITKFQGIFQNYCNKNYDMGSKA